MPNAVVVILLVLGVIAIGAFFLLGQYVNLYIQAWLSNCHVPIGRLIRWRFDRIDHRTMVYCLIRSRKAGLDVTLDQLEAHYVAGGRVPNCVTALTAAKRAGVELDWAIVTKMDLDGYDVLEAIEDARKDNLRRAKEQTARG